MATPHGPWRSAWIKSLTEMSLDLWGEIRAPGELDLDSKVRRPAEHTAE